ncbi:hypothetical protein ACS0TY_000641 [Phlomoides rotata]
MKERTNSSVNSISSIWKMIGREDNTMIYHVTINDIRTHKVDKKNTKTTTWDKNKRKEAVRIQTSIPWRHQMARKTYNLILESEQSEEARKILEEGHDRDLLVVKALTSKKIQHTSIESAQSMTILDPKRSPTKGRKARLKNHFQRSKKKSSGTTREFGTQIPNAHLF